MLKTRTGITLGAGVLATLVIVPFALHASTTSVPANAQQPHASSAKRASAAKGHLVLYSAQGYDAAMAAAFQKKTGIQVSLVDDSTGNIVARMEAERTNPHWDIAWFDGDSTMQSLANQGMLLKGFTPSDMSNYTPLGHSLLPKDHAYFPASVTAAAAIAYNTKYLSPKQAPTSWNDLLSPRFKGQVAMNDPSISGPTYPFVAGIMQQRGVKGGEAYFKALKANGLKVFPTNGVTLNALLTGQVKVIMIQDSALTKAKASGEPIRIVYPSTGVAMLPGVMAIDKNAPDMAAAKAFVQFVLSPQGQKIMLNPANGGGDSYFNPIIKGLKPDPQRQQAGIHWVRVNPVRAAATENQIKTWFHDNIVQ
ncbi:iron ABC transporter substrate-binding protein [Ferroacidibacillus organovorans]|uniref:Iron ABC transporter substrate-binding protein n=1 Tax=Ferroacidibacillus organovorans TaxID=1765683 RepID=A0A1V4EWH2_9BACL|nr:iron ABC transporter substrate-binding protein [Ferroacidibacillus organovorans]